MNKLIELLNEYEEKRIKKINSEGKHSVKLLFRAYTKESLTNKAYRSCWSEICSKYYGFIKWLVDNDKIDNSKIEIHWFSFYESVLMELAIKDNPIDFLISILKDKKVRTIYVDKDGNVSGDTKRYTYC